MQKYIVCLFFGFFFVAHAQVQDSLELEFNEYLGYVKKFHPIAKQADLTLSIGQANLMKARGGFDPKIEADYERKEFKGSEYWDRLNATFKIPTWYGIELKGNFEQNQGDFISQTETVPDNGLYSAGISMSLARGLWINERMATLKKAKFFREQTKADRDLLVNQILFDASLAYFDWLQAYLDREVFTNFLSNAEIRFEGIKKSAEAGDKAAIDTVEAKIAVQNRALELEQANVRFRNKSLELSNFLWGNDNIPLELQPNVFPDTDLAADIDYTLEILGKPLDSFTVENHPKIKSLGFKIDGLRVDKQLKTNKLLPKIDVEYNFLTESPDVLNSFVTEEYKGGLAFQFPLFLRKERGDLRLAKLKLNDAQFELDNAQIEIRNKVLAIYNELESFETQNVLIYDIVSNYQTMLSAEERKFSFGESSLFLINSRESKLIDAVLKQNSVQNKFYSAKAKLFKSLAVNPENL
ncbi:transporter [Maribacter sp. 4U21]|uniref:TolC family protein n=1 Tax=Maribacter sp. 4U21 TaxID=1889779 RepID=UPI000C145E5D|nr:TolC family protein [Maribacter sp. 4U21]PIB30842.1 transporter [Maribacter sp. 4U21]